MRTKRSVVDTEELTTIEEVLGEIEESSPTSQEPIPDNLIKMIHPAKWEGLLNILNFLTKDSDDSITIKDSVILCGYKGGSIIRADLKEIFDGELINLHIASPKKWSRLFQTLKDAGNIYIIDDDNKFIVTNEHIKLFLPKQLSSIVSALTIPSMDESDKICDMVIQKESRDTIHKLGSGSQYLEFLVKDNQIMSVSVPNTAIYILPEFVKNDVAKELTSTNADLTLRTQVFLPYPADTYKLILGRNSITNAYFTFTICRSNLITIEVYEQLDDASGLDQLF